MKESLLVPDPAHLFPVFPYVTDEQQLLTCPDYVKSFKAHAEIAEREGLIQGHEWAGRQPYPVVYLTLRDGISYALSAMQGTLILMGVLHYHSLSEEDRTTLNKTLEHISPLHERARNPKPLEQKDRLGRNYMVDPDHSYAKKNKAKQAVNETVSGLDLTKFEVDLDEFDPFADE